MPKPNNNRPKKPEEPKEPKPKVSPSSMIGNSKRLTLTYIVLAVWVALAVFAILNDGDLYGLAVYFASGLPLIIGYLWSETNRPSLKDASEILKHITDGKDDRWRRRPGGFGGGGFNPFHRNRNTGYRNDGINNTNDNDVNINIYSTANEEDEDEIVSIYSDDASVELQVNQSQLMTLMNIGYVNQSGDKYTFDKDMLSQIKSLISDNVQQPEI